MPRENANVSVAKITAKQAIIVTLITALAGLTGALLTRYSGKDSESRPTQRYLTISSVEEPGRRSPPSIRLVIEVNGQSYSYPSRALWTEIGPKMKSEAFPLPINQKSYEIRFRAFYNDGPPVTEYLNEEQHIIPVSAIPISREYVLHRINNFTRSEAAPLQVNYEIR